MRGERLRVGGGWRKRRRVEEAERRRGRRGRVRGGRGRGGRSKGRKLQ